MEYTFDNVQIEKVFSEDTRPLVMLDKTASMLKRMFQYYSGYNLKIDISDLEVTVDMNVNNVPVQVFFEVRNSKKDARVLLKTPDRRTRINIEMPLDLYELSYFGLLGSIQRILEFPDVCKYLSTKALATTSVSEESF